MAKKKKQAAATNAESHGYKNSPLGRIPEGWEVGCIEDVGQITTGTTPLTKKSQYYDGNIMFISPFDIDESVYIKHTEKKLSLLGLQVSRPIPKNTVCVVCIGSTIGKIGISYELCSTNQQINSIIPNDKNNFLVVYYLCSLYLKKQLQIVSGLQAVPIVNKRLFSKLLLPKIPLPEQSAIASILSILDEAIEKTDRLIAKYKRIKQGLMQDLFRYGIDENDRIRSEETHRFKDSPLGRIPEEWDACTLLTVIPQAQYGISTSLNDKAGIPVLRMNNLKHGKIDISDIRFSDDPEAYKLTLKKGDILFNRTNSYEHVGRTSIWNDELDNASFASYLVRLVPDLNKLTPHYLNYWLNLPEIQNAIRKYATPAVHQVNINPTNLRKTLIKLPPLPEQSRIASILSAADEAIEKEESYRHKLLALKRGLMEDLLTGKVRVPASLMKEISHA